ncbi:hypothetical protein SASPL_115581 [Salvia splendens]|uniref:Cytochrome P450 n=1 Tax=Salvia splendens TaxID=180675 RepID=A0A8X8Y402_SALSN|nr:hypothetical protein SASPL_115581 [Salvia splendens]
MDLTIVIAIIVSILAWSHFRRRRQNLPPGPYPFPIIGNILQLGRNPHRSLADLSKTHGPLMSLKLGNSLTVVASSPEIAKLLLQEHDQAFSGRTIPAAAEAHDHHKHSMALIPAGERWRKARKLCRERMFSTRQLDAGAGLRAEKVRKLLDYTRGCSARGRAVDVGEAAFVTASNLLTATLFSVDLIEFESDATQQMKEAIEGVTKILGAPNVADFFPIVKRWDPQGIKKRSEICFGKVLGVLGGIIKERLEWRSMKLESKNDLLDALVDLMEGTEYDLSFKDIQHLLLVTSISLSN